jgi:hypothetical protein
METRNMVEFPHDIPKPDRPVIRDEEWRRIAETSGLPEEARDEVELAIYWYRLLRKSTQNRRRNRENFAVLSDKLSAALKALQRMKKDQDAFWAIVIGNPKLRSLNSQERKAWQHRLNGLTDELERGLEWWRKSRDRLAVKRGRRNLSGDLYYLIRQLSFITVEYTGRMTSLSKKDRENSKLNHLKFLVLTCKAADKNIKEWLIRDVASGLVIDEDKQFF